MDIATETLADASLINNNNQLVIDEESLTPIQKFYDNCNIFITGGTGFLGKMLINKLLTACSSIDTIYLLVRNKKGKDVHSRVEDIFDDPVSICSNRIQFTLLPVWRAQTYPTKYPL